VVSFRQDIRQRLGGFVGAENPAFLQICAERDHIRDFGVAKSDGDFVDGNFYDLDGVIDFGLHVYLRAVYYQRSALFYGFFEFGECRFTHSDYALGITDYRRRDWLVGNDDHTVGRSASDFCAIRGHKGNFFARLHRCLREELADEDNPLSAEPGYGNFFTETVVCHFSAL